MRLPKRTVIRRCSSKSRSIDDGSLPTMNVRIVSIALASCKEIDEQLPKATVIYQGQTAQIYRNSFERTSLSGTRMPVEPTMRAMMDASLSLNDHSLSLSLSLPLIYVSFYPSHCLASSGTRSH